MKIDHLAMYVSDLEGARGFFERYFGASAGARYHNRTTDFRSYFLQFSSGARLEIMHRPNLCAHEQSDAALGYAHLAFSLGSREAVDELTQRMQHDGYRVLSGPRTTGDGYYESCICAFEGNLLELTV